MKKTTSLDLSKRLTQYSALTIAMAAIASANGQGIVHTVVADAEQAIGDDEFRINFNNDDPPGPAEGVHEFAVNAWSWSTGANLVVYVHADSFAIGAVPSYKYPFALNSGYTISNGNSNWQSGAGWQFLNYTNSSKPNGCSFGSDSGWCSGEDKFLGLKFLLDRTGTDYYYGWAKVQIPDASDLSTWYIKEYAYNDTPGEPINAGQTVLGIDDNELSSRVKVVTLNKSIGLYNLPETTNYKLFSMTGQEVLTGETNNNAYVIEAKTLASGVYIVEIEDANSNAVMRKKVVL